MQRLIQTTIASEHTESAISVIFVSDTSHGGESDTPIQNLRSIGLQNIIELPLPFAGERSPHEQRRIDYIDGSWIVNTFFSGDYENTDTDLIASLLNDSVIVIEQSPPELTSLTSFLQRATGVAIGAYVGVTAATAIGNPLLMFITVPFGMLIVGTASGVGSALELGLRDRILKFLKVQTKSAKRTSPRAARAENRLQRASSAGRMIDIDTNNEQPPAGPTGTR